MGIKTVKKICCVGAGYVGGPTMAVLAEKCPSIDIKVVDSNKERIKFWNSKDFNNLPIYEPGLAEIVENCRNKNLTFSSDIKESIRSADMVFISVNTPIKLTGLGANQASDLKWVESCARQIAEYAEGHTIVVEKSTLPVRTAEMIKKILIQSNNQNSLKKGKSFSVLSNPEFLAEGTAINDLIYPDRVLIGGEDNDAINSLKEIYLNWISEEKILVTNLWSSELSKLTANAFLAQRISSINSISALCEVTGADVREVSKAIGLDSRIGKSFLESGPGFGGSCFKKDILNLVYLCKFFDLNEVGAYWEQIIKINDWQQKRIYEEIVKNLFGTVSDKKIAILGFAFKANTNDTRESPAIMISKYLLEEGARLFIHDPKVSKNKINEDLNTFCKNFKANSCWEIVESIDEAIIGADAAVILTEWDEYRNLNWSELKLKMRQPAWLFDTRSIADPILLESSGINFWRLGDNYGVNKKEII